MLNSKSTAEVSTQQLHISDTTTRTFGGESVKSATFYVREFSLSTWPKQKSRPSWTLLLN